METLTYTIGTNQRATVTASDDLTQKPINWSSADVHNWVEARQYERELRSVVVYVKHADGSAYDLTGFNYVFEGLTPDGIHRVYDAKHGIALDPTHGQFRFDFPEQAFAVAGSYKQAFFRLMKDDLSVTTLEFDMIVLSDMVISGLIPSDYISPFEDLYSQLEDIIDNAGTDLSKFKDDWNTQIQAAFDKWTGDYQTISNTVTALQTQLDAMEQTIKGSGLVTQDQIQGIITKVDNAVNSIRSNLFVGTLALADSDIYYPSIHAYVYNYGAGVAQTDVDIAGGSTVYDVNVRAERVTPTSVKVYVNANDVTQAMSGFAMANATVACGNGFAYLNSGIYGLAIEAKNATVNSFAVDSAFKI